ncbi:thiamine pyrophosphate-requiring protein [Rhizobium sp. L1K21]|uniref:thiamine pyrophosphate-requiring protein n=1 Tax=Rhizobium sp. L1K21 TaxID=2954933 RepID=UPI002093F197|nr:thiamine pyrophosphate-requiring protein [Rhizobium sp. L1K21]MCO6185356.1 thiamine pyrophosphate-requiring protein [Rhizobium sp. L1K21]
MTETRIPAGSAIFPRLKALGVDYVFCNSGTDFPPIIEGLATAKARGEALPEAVVIPHESAALGMAHGYTLMTGRAQAVMMHTNVGLANGAMGAINAAAEQIPVILMSGRTPTLEAGRLGARTVPIGWGQEMRDQHALVREATKWDYELRFPEQITELLDRAHAIASSTPKGPVYLSLPREVLCEEIVFDDLTAEPSIAPATGAADQASIEKLAAMLATAKSPLIIAQRGVGDADGFAAFARWAEEWGIAVSSWWVNQLAIATDHPCHVGPNPGPWMAEADVVLAIDCLAPWMPEAHALKQDAKVVHLGPDPLYARFPVRNFPSHLSLAGDTGATLTALFKAMQLHARDEGMIAERRKRIAQANQSWRDDVSRVSTPVTGQTLTKPQLSRALSDALKGRKSTVFCELGAVLGPMERSEAHSWFDTPHSGGLGWSFPAAMGAQLADPDRLCVAVMGDGSYMFANPTVCHQIAEAMQLPILIVIANNSEWDAVRRSVTSIYPEGHAAKSNQMPLVELKPSPDFCKTAEASRAFARRVEKPEELSDAIEAALKAIETEGRCAVLDVKIR